MKNYKDFEKIYIGSSDVAALILAGCYQEEGLKTQTLHFGEDGSYEAYLIEGEDVTIGSHYKKMATFNHWLKIYDDNKKTFSMRAKEINVYRAGDSGCIVQAIN
ncbi:MAG: hypothetical protein K1W24_02680 [Lachnospiraceae bacterium]